MSGRSLLVFVGCVMLTAGLAGVLTAADSTSFDQRPAAPVRVTAYYLPTKPTANAPWSMVIEVRNNGNKAIRLSSLPVIEVRQAAGEKMLAKSRTAPAHKIQGGYYPLVQLTMPSSAGLGIVGFNGKVYESFDDIKPGASVLLKLSLPANAFPVAGKYTIDVGVSDGIDTIASSGSAEIACKP